ncbi:hypothetical protein [Nocardia sp. NPDC049707]|uniref:hypothetical protein n=1 Tax=Nocardia sp. NPDC049707 TaxID=3154735 RepID=UPI00344565E7
MGDGFGERPLRALAAQERAEGLQLTGESGLLTKLVVESAPEGEMDDYLGYSRHDAAGGDNEVSSGPVDVARTGRTIQRADPGYFELGSQLRGRGSVIQSSRDAPLRPGDFARYGTHRPYTLRSTPISASRRGPTSQTMTPELPSAAGLNRVRVPIMKRRTDAPPPTAGSFARSFVLDIVEGLEQ